MSSPSLRSPSLTRFYATTPGPSVAFLDESMRAPVRGSREQPFYQLASVIFPREAMDQVREGLVDIAGERYWHTTEAFKSKQYDSILEMSDYITQESDWNIVAVQMPMGGSDQSMAQARSRCLAQLTRELTRGSGENALRAIVADNNREPELNNRDLKVVDSLRSRGEIARDVAFTHGRMGQEPLLWAADVMSWSVRRNIALDDPRFIQPTLDEGKLTLINAIDGQQLNMKHPQAAAAKTWGPSTLGPDSQLRLGNRESDVASASMIPSRGDANNSRGFTQGSQVSSDLLRQIRALGEEARRGTRAAVSRGTDTREQSPAMAEVSKDLRAIRGAMSGRDEEAASPVKHESPHERGPRVDNSDIAPPSV